MRTLFVVVMALLVCATLLCAQTTPPPAEAPKAQETVKAPAKPAPVNATMVGEIAVKTIPATLVASVMEKAATYEPKDGYKPGMEGTSLAYETMMMKGFEALGAWMKAGGRPMGPPMAFYYEDPTKTAAKDLTCKVCFPTDTSAKGDDAVKIETLPEEKCAVVQYKGSYEMADDVWNALDKWIIAHNFESAGAPSETYLKGPGDTASPAEYLTEIHMPVKPVEAKKDEPKK